MVANKSSGIQLKCDDHKDKAQLVFKQLANDKMFSDVTLVSEDGKKFAAHRAIIGYSSPYLHSILKEKLTEEIINLEVKTVHIKCMLEYLYLGETKVEVNEIKDFLNMANKFQIRGLWLEEGYDASDKSNYKIQDVRELETALTKEEQCETKSIIEKTETAPYAKPITKSSDDKKYLCAQCTFRSTLKRDLIKHKETEHEKVIEKIQCEECGYIGTKNALKTHKLTHSGVILSCSRCDYTTLKPLHLKEHARNVHEPVYVYCDKCAFRAKTLRYLKGHNEREHEGKIYICDKCDFKSKFSERFEDHKKGVHDGIKYECDQCIYTSTFRAPMFNHKQVKHDNIRHACKMCSYVATRSYNLRAHERKIHQKVQK